MIPEEEILLKDLLKDMHDYVEKKDINLLSEYKNVDVKGDGFIHIKEF